MQGFCAGSQTCEGRFGIDPGDFAGQSDHASRQGDGPIMIFLRRDCLKERGTRTNKRDQPGVAVRGDRPKQIDPLVKAFGQRSQNIAAGNKQVHCGRPTAFEKGRRAPS